MIALYCEVFFDVRGLYKAIDALRVRVIDRAIAEGHVDRATMLKLSYHGGPVVAKGLIDYMQHQDEEHDLTTEQGLVRKHFECYILQERALITATPEETISMYTEMLSKEQTTNPATRRLTNSCRRLSMSAGSNSIWLKPKRTPRAPTGGGRLPENFPCVAQSAVEFGMHSETRRGTTGSYLYRSQREGEKVRKKYLGKASSPLLAAVHGYQQCQDAARHRDRQEAIRQADVAKQICALCDRLATLVDRADVLHELSQRQRRSRRESVPMNSSTYPPQDVVDVTLDSLPTDSAFAKLQRRVDAGDEEAAEELRRLLRKSPAFMAKSIDLMSITRSLMIGTIAGTSVTIRIALEEQLARDTKALQRLFGDDESTRLLVEIVGLFRLEAFRTHCMLASVQHSHTATKFWSAMAVKSLKRCERAVTRLLTKSSNDTSQ